MIEKTIRLNGISQVKELNMLASQTNCDVDLRSGRYCVDAKSIMGIFSLELTGPLTLVVDTDDAVMVDLKFSQFYEK